MHNFYRPRPTQENIPPRWARLGRDLLAEELLESLAILGKFLDTLVELVEGHGVLEELPAELRLIVDVGHLSKGLVLGGYIRVVCEVAVKSREK